MLAFLPDTLLTLHIIAGILSLVLFWLPIITKKGRTAHRRIGRVYTYAMSTVVITALVLSGIRLVSGDPEAGWALLFLAVLTTVPLMSGVQVLKAKQPTQGYRRLRLWLAGMLLSVSIALLVGWQVYESGLLLAFGIIGVLASAGDARQYIRAAGSGKTWLREHYEAMLFSGAAAYTAFFAFGGRTLLSSFLIGWWMLVPWILPTLLTVALLPLVHRRFKQNQKKESTKHVGKAGLLARLRL